MSDETCKHCRRPIKGDLHIEGHYAVPALLTYADSCAAEYPMLAADLRRMVS